MLNNTPPKKEDSKQRELLFNCVFSTNKEQVNNCHLFTRLEDLLERTEKALIKMETATSFYNNLKMSRSFRDAHKIGSRLEDIEDKIIEVLETQTELAFRISSKPLNEKERLRKEFEEVLK
jgi:hypothetical protein